MISSPVARALWGGAVVGAVVGASDAMLAWDRLEQFLPSLGGRLRAGLYAAALGAVAAALTAAVCGALVVGFCRCTALGRLWRLARERHAARREADPRRAMTGLALALAGPPAFGLALYGAYLLGLHTLAVRHHPGLITAATIGATIAFLGAAALLAFAAAAALEVALGQFRGRAARLLSHPLTPMLVAGTLLLCGVAAAGWTARSTLEQLPIRPYLVAALALVGFPAAWPLAGWVVGRWRRVRRPLLRDLVHPLLVGGGLALIFATGADPAVRKAASAHIGSAGPIVGGIQWLVDLDRDGYSPVLGGGDCDDLAGDIHPGAVDIPGDGVDQNCGGGDLQTTAEAADTRFVPHPPGVPRELNVLLVTIDTLRADHVGAYGYGRATTPTLDALAAEGALFENAFAHAPSTRYSMPAILTGRYPSRVLWDESVWWPALRPENRTVAEALREAGLATGAILNYAYFDQVRRMDQGFDTYRNDNAHLHQGGNPASTHGSSSREQADGAIRFLEQHTARRFFLWVHFYDPHFEYERHPGTAEFGASKVDRYDHEIRFTDDHLARVFTRLRELGQWDKTVVLVTGDHGEGFGEHGVDFHGYHLYAAQTRVPLIIRVPGLAPARVSMPAGHVDILPTLANLVGQDPDPAMSGRSLLGEMAGLPGSPADADREVYQEVSFEGPTEKRGVVTRRWHLLYNMVPDNSWELYDLAADPAEARDVWGAHDVDALADRLRGWIESAQLPSNASELLAGARVGEPPAPQRPLDVTFAGAIHLVGYDLAPVTARPGEDLTMTWYFRCDRPLEGSWGVFVHFEGPTRFTGDHDPVGGALPFSHCDPGEILADTHTFRVPPTTRPGDYTVQMGLWRRKTDLRAPAQAAGSTVREDRVNVGTLRVRP